jgi:RNA polymerase sigma factor (sigma-70 family)
MEEIQMKTQITISYTLADGEQLTLSVLPEIADVLRETDNKIKALNRQDRRHLDATSLEDAVTKMRRRPEQPDETVLRREKTNRLHRLMNRLTAKQRSRLTAHAVYGFSLAEIAQYEGVSIQAVSDSVDQARKKLKEFLADT